MEKISIYVASHKQIALDLPDCYRICQVNAEKNGRWEGAYVHDNDSPDNISFKNDRYCELTALYELWKNDQSDIKGLVHYRRFFSDSDKKSLERYVNRYIKQEHLYHHVLSRERIEEYLHDSDMIVEYPQNPYIVNAREDLQRFVFPKDILVMDGVISKYYPEYLQSYETVMHATNISYLNMFVAKAEICDAYCAWLFPVLEKIEAELVGIDDYDTQHKRIYGYLAEVLLNVWILKNGIKPKYVFTKQLPEAAKIRAKAISKQLLTPIRFSTGYMIRYRLLSQAAKKPYSTTLDDVYRRFRSHRDVLRFYHHFSQTVCAEEEVMIEGKSLPYVSVRMDYYPSYAYPQSNGRCLVTLFSDDAEGLPAFMGRVRDQYADTYTVTFRVVTKNPEMRLIEKHDPELYVFCYN